MGKLIRLMPLLAMLVLVSPARSQDLPDFDIWLNEVRTEALAEGISAGVLDVALRDVQPVRRIVERDRSQAEFKLTYQIYADRLLTPTNIRVGNQRLREEAAVLGEIEKKYGVQPRFILAIWGMETRYGAVKPTMPVIPALATLAYDRRRSSYFRRELFQALWMLEKGHIDHASMLGSWAGAMGQPQFMPSSYMAYARDFDGDGRRDIWNTRADVFASIANYLKSHGWHSDQTWGRRVLLPADAESVRSAMPKRTKKSGCRAIDAMSGPLRLSEWQALGVRRMDGRDLPTRDLPASLVEPDGPGGPAFLVYRNYHSILRYNCAHLYGLTVSALADQIAAK
ncbi:lytic murein transglycosylase [Minwuia sp.]|uniref:lytic murein transglycosylase n=1 Tax=Minwuia sp. TaxID=2493630 RepID=UPI003A958028